MTARRAGKKPVAKPLRRKAPKPRGDYTPPQQEEWAPPSRLSERDLKELL